jgi:hypothetical protein
MRMRISLWLVGGWSGVAHICHKRAFLTIGLQTCAARCFFALTVDGRVIDSRRTLLLITKVMAVFDLGHSG